MSGGLFVMLCVLGHASFNVSMRLLSIMYLCVFVYVLLSTVVSAPVPIRVMEVSVNIFGRSGGAIAFGTFIPEYDVARSCRYL